MVGRSMLGSVDVNDATLLAYAVAALDLDPATAQLSGSAAEMVDYDLEAITTGGRWWVTAEVATPAGTQSVRFFVKLVQSWSRSPLFMQVPPEVREFAERAVPWRTEPLVYQSDLRDRLPAGLTMAEVVDVRPVDDLSAAVWLREVEVVAHDWSVADLARAARLLGRVAASPSVRPVASIDDGETPRGVRTYAEGRLALQVAPMLRADDLWQHPLLADAFSPTLRARLLTHLDRVSGYVDWLEAVPPGAAHGDACTNNLLVQPNSTDVVLIDFGFWGTQPLGFDLSQLLLGDVQLGRRPAEQLAEIEAACVPAYVSGLNDEGCGVPLGVVQRAHALQMLIFSGFSAFMIEELMAPPSAGPNGAFSAEVRHRAAQRAQVTEFCLDLVDSTARQAN